MDMVATYAASKAWSVRRNIVLVEGSSDEAVFKLADELSAKAGRLLLGDDISIVAAGQRDRGGTFGVARELITLRSIIPLVLDRHGKPFYRVIGLVDSDVAGRRIIRDVVRMDRGALEFRDIVALRPVSPQFVRTDPPGREMECELANLPYRDLEWEIEDTLSSRLFQIFEQRFPNLNIGKNHQGDKTHYELTPEGKNALHKIIHQEATLEDMVGVEMIVRMLRSMLVT